MTASDIRKVTEPHRNSIGWSFLGLGAVMALAVGISWHNHQISEENRQTLAHNRELLEIAKHQNLTRLEDAVRDIVSVSGRPLIIKHMGTHEPGDEMVVAWPDSAEKLLGWTLDDVQEGGLEIMIPEQWRESHDLRLEEAVERPVDERVTQVIHTEGIHKDGHRVPVRITAWAVGDTTRSLAAFIDPDGRWEERQLREGN